MKLLPAPPSREMQEALANPNVHKIVDILLTVRGDPLFNLITLFLRFNKQGKSFRFETNLRALRNNSQRRSTAISSSLFLHNIDELITTLQAIYGQDDTIVGYLR